MVFGLPSQLHFSDILREFPENEILGCRHRYRATPYAGIFRPGQQLVEIIHLRSPQQMPPSGGKCHVDRTPVARLRGGLGGFWATQPASFFGYFARVP